MEAPHVVILRKNLVYLKEYLEAGEALDHLYQEGVFTHSEYNRCKQTGPDKCRTLLELLLQKGEEAYKSLIVFMASSQPDIKKHLDATATDEGATSILFITKSFLEQEHRQDILEKDEILYKLQDEISEVRKELFDKDKALEEKVKEKEKLETVSQEREKEYALNLAEEERKREKLKAELKERRNEVKQVQKALDVIERKYESVTQLASEVQEATEEIEEIQISDEGCVFRHHEACDQLQLMLLSCLHAGCKPCLDHITELDEGKLLCPCGEPVELKTEEMPFDHARRNEEIYNVRKDTNSKCIYNEHEEDEDASLYCQDCDDYFCPECKLYHDKRTKHKSHKIMEVQQMKTMPIQKWLKSKSCVDHPDYQLDLYDHHCNKPICFLCSKGSHKHPDNEELELVFQHKKSILEDILSSHQSHLTKITKCVEDLEDHKKDQDNTVNTLESEVVSMHKNVASRFLIRQKHLKQEVRESLQEPKQVVLEKLKIARRAEKSVLSTIKYIKTSLESTRQAELIGLTDTIQKKSVEDLKTQLPKDNTRDTRVRLFFQGQKALEEIIDEFGCLATLRKMEIVTDSQPTLRDTRREMNDLTLTLGSTKNELEDTREELKVAKDRLANCDFVVTFLEQGIPVYIVAPGEGKPVGSNVLTCPHMNMNNERVFKLLSVSGENECELVNCEESGVNHHPNQFQIFEGTCSNISILLPASPTAPTSAQYWETHTRVQMKGNRLSQKCPLLEIGVCREGDVNTRYWVSLHHNSSWSISVRYCVKHKDICTQVFAENKRVGECEENELKMTVGSDSWVKHGVVLDIRRGILALFDIDKEQMLQRFDVKFTETLYPLFSVTRMSDVCDVRMKLVSGSEVKITESKKHLIREALFGQ